MAAFSFLNGMQSLVDPEISMAWFVVALLWSLVWKGLALWVTARRRQGVWFVVFMILNTLGIVEIIYLLATKGFDELKTKK